MVVTRKSFKHIKSWLMSWLSSLNTYIKKQIISHDWTFGTSKFESIEDNIISVK